MTCPDCRADNPPGARFCGSCGHALELVCPACATQLPRTARFCFNCGHELQAGATAHLTGRPARAATSMIAEQLRASTTGPGERRTITLLFCDVKDSTATAERLDPEEWSAIMRQALDRFIAPVERFGGTVVRILGDAILAYFGAPVAHEDDPQRAVLAGLAIVDGCRDLDNEVQRRFAVPFQVRVGINTGLVVVGEIGSPLYAEYAALGDAANVAARMEQSAQPNTVVIAEATHRLVAPLFDTEPMGQLPVKGRQEPVAAYRVLRPSAQPGSLRGIAGLSSPLVGRDIELGMLTTALADLRAGHGGIVSVVGEAGLGKSRLVTEFAQRAGDGLTWLEGGCFSYESTTPYAPFTRALTPFFQLKSGDDPQRRYQRIAVRMTELTGSDGARHAAHLAGVLGAAVAPEHEEFVRFLEPPLLRQRVFDTVAALLAAQAAHGPVVVLIEDVHWADRTSIDLLESLLPLTDRHPVMLLLCLRPDRSLPSWQVHRAAAAHNHTVVELRPLSERDAGRLVANLLRVEGLPGELRKLILGKAEGNPLFVEELIRSLIDAGAVIREGDRFVSTKAIEQIQVPDTLVGVLTARLDALDVPARRVLQTAAVIGRDFGADMLEELVNGSVPLDAVVAELQRRELIIALPGTRFSFRHALIRDAAYETLLVSARRDTHRMIGKLIEERQPDSVNELAHHFLHADEPFRALPYLVDSGDRAFGAFAVSDAARLYRQALDIWADGQDIALARRAYEGLGRALMFAGDLPAALDTFARLEAFAAERNDPAARASALNKLAMAHLVGTGNMAEAQHLLLTARRAAEQAADVAGVAEFHVGYCVYNMSVGHLDEASQHLGEAAEVCFSLDPYHRNFGLTHYASTLLHQVRLDEARTALDRARAQAEKDGDKQHLGHLLMLEGQLDLCAGHGEDALAKALAGMSMAAEIGALLDEEMAAWTAGAMAFRVGRYQAALELFQRVIEISGQTAFFPAVAAAQAAAALTRQRIHGPGSKLVLDLLEHARTSLTMPMGGYTLTAVYADIATTLLGEGRLREASEAAEQAIRTPSAMMMLSRPEALLCLGHVDLASNRREEAIAWFAQASAYVQEHGLRHYLPRTLLGEAVTADDRDRLVDRLQRADKAAADMQLRDVALQVRTTGARLLAAAGLQDLADDFSERSAASITEIAGLIDDGELRSEFLRTHALLAG